MRTPTWARWASCALALSLCVPTALAEGRTKKSIASCTAFDQQDKGDDAVAFTIHNTCTIPVDCSISWRLVCAPDTKKRRSSHPASAKIALSDGTSQSKDASAAVCGDDSWAIDSIQWSCEPNKD